MRPSVRSILAAGLMLPALLAGQAHAACNADIQLTKLDSNYTDNFDGTVTDTLTGLTWAKCSLGQTWVDDTPNDGSDDQCTGTATTYTWKGAMEAALSTNGGDYLGQTDWRMPNKKELKSLVESACYSPSINSSLFPATPPSMYWTSSPYTDISFGVWSVSFDDGNVVGNDKSDGGGGVGDDDVHVRVVRGGQ